VLVDADWLQDHVKQQEQGTESTEYVCVYIVPAAFIIWKQINYVVITTSLAGAREKLT
jgi:hypothetical protein